MAVTTAHQDVATTTVDVGGTSFAYRDLGPRAGTPVIFLNHLAANLVFQNHAQFVPQALDFLAA